MPAPSDDPEALRRHRNSKLYRCLTRVLREYNRRLVDELHARGFEDFSPAFPQFLSNVDLGGTRIGTLAARAGVSRQAAGKQLAEIERRGYVELRDDRGDARATIVTFTARGRRLLATVLELVEKSEGEFAAIIGAQRFEHVRAGLFQLAEALDPTGALGRGDRGDRGDRRASPSRR